MAEERKPPESVWFRCTTCGRIITPFREWFTDSEGNGSTYCVRAISPFREWFIAAGGNIPSEIKNHPCPTCREETLFRSIDSSEPPHEEIRSPDL